MRPTSPGELSKRDVVLFAEPQRSSRVALETFTGDDETIDFHDTLGDEMTLSHVEPHLAMERQLGIQAPRML